MGDEIMDVEITHGFMNIGEGMRRK